MGITPVISVLTRDMAIQPHGCIQTSAEAAKQRQPLRVTSRELLENRNELIIVHDGREYRLRITQNGKLILTA